MKQVLIHIQLWPYATLKTEAMCFGANVRVRFTGPDPMPT